MRILPFWIRLLLTLNKAWIPSSLIHLKHRNWTLPWMSLMLLHLQSLLGFSAQLVLFLIILSHSLLLAFILVNCGARLGLFLPLCLWLPRCKHLNWFVTFLAILQPLDSGPLLHQITSPWILPMGKLHSLLFSDWCWCLCPCYSWHRATHLLPQGCPCWYSFLATQCWGRYYTCVWGL